MLCTRPIRFLLFVALVCFPSAAAAQRNKPTGRSIISGRALFADSNRPVRRATIALYANLNYPPVRVTPANQRGEFRFTEVAAGSYFVMAQAPGLFSPLSSFALTEFGLSNIEVEQTQVTVDGKNTIRCELRVVRAGSIKGTITYADKEPVVNGRIVMFRRKDGVVVPFFANEVSTNDRGMYRIDGLPEGEYFVGIVMGRSVLDDYGPRRQVGAPSGFYPGVRTLNEAKGIVVEPGAEAAGVDITLAVDDVHDLSGVVKWQHNGEPVSGAALTFQRKDEPRIDVSLSGLFRAITEPGSDRDDTMMRDMGIMMMALPANIEADSKGEWRVQDLPPGTYLITAYGPLPRTTKPSKAGSQPGNEPAPDETAEQRHLVGRQIEVTIDKEDRKDITIELTPGGRIFGTVSVADGSLPPQIPISINQNHSTDLLLSFPSFSKPDGTFVLEGVSAGAVRLEVEFLTKDFYVKSITLGARDLTRESLQISEGAEVTGVQIVLGKGLATLNGRVQFTEDGTPAAGAGVLLVKSDPGMWRLGSSRFFANADATGAFTLACPPGDYLVLTWPAGGQPLGAVADYVQSQAATARTISLRSKEEKQVELTVTRPGK